MKKKKKKMSFSKKLLIIFFINCFLLEVFTGFVTLQSLHMAIAIGSFPDFTPLITLISEVIGQAIAYGIYCAKSAKENTVGGIIYEQTMQNQSSTEEETIEEDTSIDTTMLEDDESEK